MTPHIWSKQSLWTCLKFLKTTSQIEDMVTLFLITYQGTQMVDNGVMAYISWDVIYYTRNLDFTLLSKQLIYVTRLDLFWYEMTFLGTRHNNLPCQYLPLSFQCIFHFLCQHIFGSEMPISRDSCVLFENRVLLKKINGGMLVSYWGWTLWHTSSNRQQQKSRHLYD